MNRTGGRAIHTIAGLKPHDDCQGPAAPDRLEAVMQGEGQGIPAAPCPRFSQEMEMKAVKGTQPVRRFSDIAIVCLEETFLPKQGVMCKWLSPPGG